MRLKSLFTLFLLFFVFSSPCLARDDFQYRSLYTFKIIDTKKIDFSLFNQVRFFNDAQDVGFYSISPKLQYEWMKNMSLGLNYTYLQTKVFNKTAGREEFKFHHRVELDANPHFERGDWLKIQMRNRYEFRWIEDRGSWNPRFRHRTQVEFPLKNKLPLQSIYINSEFFYDIDKHVYNENWTTPLGFKFKINEKTSLSLYYMIQRIGVSNDWSSNQILGTHLLVNF